MKSQDFFALQDAYRVMYAEAKDESPEKEEEDRKKDDDLAGSPNKNGDDKNGKKNGKKKAKRWWDDDGDGIGYEKGEVKEAVYGKSPAQVEGERRKKDNLAGSPLIVTNADKKANTKAYQNLKAGVKGYKAADHMKEGYGKKKKHDCASKVKHEEYGVGNCIAEMHDLDENGNVAHYDVLFEHGVEKNVPVETLQILEGHMHEHYIAEKQKDTPDQVAAVIDMYRSKKGTDAATYDSMHGKKKEAKKERDYAKFERDKMARDAQKSGHPWEHAKGSTTEKEGKKSVKHAHVKDSYDWQTESDLWDDIAEKLSELHELGGVKFKVVPFDLQEEENWIQGAVKRPGAFTKKAKAAGMSVQQFAKHVDANKDKYSTRTERQANLAQTFSKMKKEGADYDALSSFLVQEGADDQAVNYILANWVEDDRLGKLEESEKVARGAQKRAEVLASRRRQKGYREQGYNAYRPGKNEKAGYNLARAARSSESDLETQRTKKKKPAGEDTSQIGHYKKRDEKVTVGKRGKPLSRPKYKLTMGQRVDHHSNKALSRRDPKQNPKHTANK